MSWLKRDPKPLPMKIALILLGVVFCLFLMMITGLIWLNHAPDHPQELGVTFSPTYTEELGLDVQEVYSAIVQDLGVRKVRLPVYWSRVEATLNEPDWEELDWLIAQSEARDVALTLAIGAKVPRWPECYIPAWAENAPEKFRDAQLLEFMKQVVLRYRKSPAIERWQVENEPFFPFGECPEFDPKLFFEEIELVRSLDDRPIQVTVSGELDPWARAAEVADILGVSMYRLTWNNIFGYWFFPVEPGFYRIRAAMSGRSVDQVIISELQAEPWFPEPIESRRPADWYESFDAQLFEDNVTFAKRTGISEVYLWGVEWWYALKQDGEPRLWEFAREIF